jgi:serine/threonine protein phosphatase PrpC
MLSYYGLSDPGCTRDDNEDRIALVPELGFYVVADGMGGHRRGELAAEVAISTMKHYIGTSRTGYDVTWPFGYNLDLSLGANLLTTAIRLANRQVWKQAESGPECAGMGTTIAAVMVHGRDAAVANVGDSRAYLLRSGELVQLTTDDTWVNAVLHKGALDEKSLLNHPMRHVLTQAAGSQNDVDVHTADLVFRPGDLLLVSSDGLHDVVGNTEIRDVMLSVRDLAPAAARLIECARAAGAPDNVSCILLRYDDGPDEPAPGPADPRG